MTHQIDTYQTGNIQTTITKIFTYDNNDNIIDTKTLINTISGNSYNFSIAPNKPPSSTITNSNWWRLKADHGMNQALYPRNFADAHFRLRKIERKSSMITNPQANNRFNRSTFNRNLIIV
ncbi:MAG TPA: hypothetical protein V6C58_11510 [Allocoleopsis sp.]